MPEHIEQDTVVSLPIKKLVTSILYMAVLDYTRDAKLSNYSPVYKKKKLDEYNEAKLQAKEWFLSDENKKDHFSFVQVCEVLNLCPTTIRRKLSLLDSESGFKITKTRRTN